MLNAVEVEYITMPGWQCSIAAARTYNDLPANARAYIEKIEETPGEVFKSDGKKLCAEFLIYFCH